MIEELARLVGELCDGFINKEPRYEGTATNPSDKKKFIGWYKVEYPGLLQQLRDMVDKQVVGIHAGSSHKSFESAEPGNLEAFSTLEQIRREVFNEACFLSVTRSYVPEDNLHACLAVVGQLHPDDAAELLARVRTWHRAASRATGWLAAATAEQDGTRVCPEPRCNGVGTLRVDLKRRTVRCDACGSQWSQQRKTEMAA